ncbi:MAG: TolC family protein [Acidobacteria bacterium]|nr:TolC family protein [Acidobacteriota bacterium]
MKLSRMFLVVALLACGETAHAQAPQPLTLRQAVETALENNPRLRASGYEADAARARVDQARAAWFPRVDFVQTFTRGNNPVYVFGTLLTQRQFTAANFALSGLNAPTPLDNFQTRFEGQWLLYDFGRRRLGVRGARQLSTAQDYKTEQERQDLILRVVRAYYGVIIAGEDLEAARGAVRTAEASEQRVRTLEKAGLVVASDVLSAQVHTAQMREREIRATNALDLARITLNHELGASPDKAYEPVEKPAEPRMPVSSLDEYERIALASRPALRAAEIEQQAAASSAKLAKAEFGPRIGMYASFERDAETLGGPSGTNWIAGARLDVNLFAGGADKARLAEARARERQAENQVEWFRSGVRLEVRQAYLATRAAQQRVQVMRDSTEQADESLRIIQNRYEAGLATITDLLRAQVAALDARTGYLSAVYDWQLSRAQLERAAGRLTPDLSFVSTELP